MFQLKVASRRNTGEEQIALTMSSLGENQTQEKVLEQSCDEDDSSYASSSLR
jgi:hypothetical protein